jgi:NAD-dependent DNA ligase
MADVGAGDLQTLISTLQNSNKQSGHMIKAIEGVGSSLASSMSATVAQAVAQAVSQALASASAAQSAVTPMSARAAVEPSFGAAIAAGGPLPVEPDGYITITIPGVGDRFIPYYSAG